MDYLPLAAAAAAGIGNGVVVKMSSGGPHPVLYPGIYEGALIAGGALLSSKGNNDVAEALTLVGVALLAARALYKVAPGQVTAGYVAQAATTATSAISSGSHGGATAHSSGSTHIAVVAHSPGKVGSHSPERASHSSGTVSTERRAGAGSPRAGGVERRGTRVGRAAGGGYAAAFAARNRLGQNYPTGHYHTADPYAPSGHGPGQRYSSGHYPTSNPYVEGQLPHGFDSGVGAIDQANAGVDYGNSMSGFRAATAGQGMVAEAWFAPQLGSGHPGVQTAGISTPGPWVGPSYDSSLMDTVLYGQRQGYYDATQPVGRIA